MNRKLLVITVRKSFLYLFIIVALFTGFGHSIYINGLLDLPVFSTPDSMYRAFLVVDPGHGGPDGGAVGVTGALEKDIVLDIAQRLRSQLGRIGVKVILTRTGDYDLAHDDTKGYSARKREDLQQRVSMANELSPDMFISIHANSMPDSRWMGAQTFYHQGSLESKLLAEMVQVQLIENLEPNTRKAKPGDKYILENIKGPAVLIEVGFLSNPHEEALLQSSHYRERVAYAIRRGIEEYLELL